MSRYVENGMRYDQSCY